MGPCSGSLRQSMPCSTTARSACFPAGCDGLTIGVAARGSVATRQSLPGWRGLVHGNLAGLEVSVSSSGHGISYSSLSESSGFVSMPMLSRRTWTRGSRCAGCADPRRHGGAAGRLRAAGAQRPGPGPRPACKAASGSYCIGGYFHLRGRVATGSKSARSTTPADSVRCFRYLLGI